MSRTRSILKPLALAPTLATLLLGGFTLPCLSANSRPTLRTATHSVVVLGDSIAAGYGLEPHQSFPTLLQEKAAAAQLPVRIVNAGLSGDTSAGGLRRIDWLLKQPVDVLLLELGGNDGLRGIAPAATQTNLQAIIRRTKQRYPETRIVVAGMQMPPNMGATFTTAFRDLFPQLAQTNQATLIPFLLEGVGGSPELNQPDRIHPTDEGQRRIADTVWRYLEPVLRQIVHGSNSPAPPRPTAAPSAAPP